MKKVFLTLAVAATIFASCDKNDDPKVDPQPTAENLTGDITSNMTLNADITYTLTGTVRVKDGAKLTIPAGTLIKSQSGFDKYIIVEQGGQIFVNGTADKPVKMTSAASTPEPGDWGGLIINGKAKISGTAGTTPTGTTEIDPTKPYGGSDDADNSGSITYLILEYCGAKSSANIEHNGLTLDAVGSGTKIENVYIPYSADDGVEFFGGTVNVKNLLVVNSDDDCFDVTQGWRGTLDNAYGVWLAGFTSGEDDPRGTEIDGNLDGNTPDDVNQSNFTFQNITIANKSNEKVAGDLPVMQDVVKVRRGATATITNLLIKGTACQDLIDLTDSKGNGNKNTSISYKNDGMTFTGAEVKNPDGASITANEANTGANTSVFSWTGFTNF